MANEPGGATTFGSIACGVRELQILDNLLNQYYRERRELLEEPYPTPLRDAQRAWITLRDEDCEATRGEYGGASLFAFDPFGRGRMAAIAHAAGWSPRDLVGPASNEDYLRALFAERGLSPSAPE